MSLFSFKYSKLPRLTSVAEEVNMRLDQEQVQEILIPLTPQPTGLRCWLRGDYLQDFLFISTCAFHPIALPPFLVNALYKVYESCDYTT